MNTYLVTYDLRKHETASDYVDLISFLKTYPKWAKLQQSTWLIKTTQEIGDARTAIRQNLDSNDKLLVIDVSGANWATFNQSKKIVDWMRSNV